MNARVLHLKIDRIIIDGLPASAQHRFVRALESGLTQMANDGFVASQQPSRRRIASLDAGQLRPGSSAEQAAGQVLQAIQTKLAPTHQSSRTEAKRNG